MERLVVDSIELADRPLGGEGAGNQKQTDNIIIGIISLKFLLHLVADNFQYLRFHSHSYCRI